MAYLTSVNWLAVFLFSALVLVIVMFMLSVAGHFPKEQRRAEFKDRLGRLVIAVCSIAVAVATAKTFGLAATAIPPPIAIIGAGAALLGAPLVLRYLSDSFVDGRVGLVSLAALASILSYFAGQFKS